MFIHGIEYWGLNLVVTMVAAYAVVLAVAFAVVGARRLVGQGDAEHAIPAHRRSLDSERNSAVR